MRRALLAVVLTAGLLATPAAVAAPTGTAVSTPADGLRLTSTDGTTKLAVTGTTTGGAAKDPLGLRCFPRPGRSTPVGSTTVGPGGAFAADAFLADVRGPCVLRAVPAGLDLTSADLAPFPGPLLTVEAQRTTTLTGGPNAGIAVGLDDWLQQSAAGVGLCSLGSSGLCGGRLFDAAARVSTEPVFSAGGWVGASSGTRSYLQVDGANAYPPARAAQLSPDASGLQGLTRSAVDDAGDGRPVLVESDPLLRCPAGAPFPPAAGDCPAFTDTGVRYERTSTIAADGTTIEQRDVLIATDGRAHTVSADLGQSFLIDPAVSPGLRFGWLRGDVSAPRATGLEVGGPTKGPATVFVASSAAAPDGDPVYAQGAVTFDPAPASLRATAPTDLLVRFLDRAVPAGGRADLVRSTYTLTRTAAEAAARAATIEAPLLDRANLPTVAFLSPKNGATVLTPSVTVVGTASDDQGIASLRVGGQAVPLSPTGRFSVAVPMAKGANAISAVATDHAGNEATATLRLSYSDRLPPAVGRLFIEPRVWRAGRATRLRFSLGEAGTLRLTAVRVSAGRRRRGACVAATPALKRARAAVCARDVVAATQIAVVQAPGVTTAIGPKLGGRVLPPGRYTLRVTVTDYARNVSVVRSLPLTLKPTLPRPVR
ncbi:MAG: hypothetical protein JWM31_280 [Solirubrobacterales bacterium]|nr:hypothetical protein [Solirubrobacterales bacterium]